MNKKMSKFAYNLDNNGHVIRYSEPYHNDSVDDTPVQALAVPGIVTYISAWNDDATDTSFLKLYDSVAEPVVGTDKPVFVAAVKNKSDFKISFSSGISVQNSLWVASVGGVSDSNVVSPSTAMEVDLGLVY